MIQLAVEDEVLVMPLDLMSEWDTGLACAGLGCGGLGDIAPSDKVLRKLAKADKAAKKAARKGGQVETPPIIPSLPDFVLPKVGQPIDIPPGPPQQQYVVDWIPRPETWTFPGPTDPVLALPPKVGVLPVPSGTVTLPPATGGSYQPPVPDGRDYMDPLLPTPVEPRRDWRQVLGAPRRGRRRPDAGSGSDTGRAVKSPPFQAPPTVSVGPPASPAGSVGMPVAPEPTEQAPADPGVLNIGGMQIRTSTLMWAGAIVGGFILLNNMTGKKR